MNIKEMMQEFNEANMMGKEDMFEEMVERDIDNHREISELRAALTAAQEEAQRTRDILEAAHEEIGQLRALRLIAEKNRDEQLVSIDALVTERDKLREALMGCAWVIERLPQFALDQLTDDFSKMLGNALNKARAALGEK